MTKQKLTVSVFVPVFNEEKYLPKFFDSLLIQSHAPDEVVVCNNNSSDNSVKIINSYSDKLPIVLVHQPVKGILPTAEAAWRAATGDILIRTDADTIAPKDWIKNIISRFESDSKISALGGLWESHDGTAFMRILIHFGLQLGEYVNIMHYGYRQIWGCNFAIRKSVMQKIDGFKTSNPNTIEDRLIAAKLHKNNFYFTNFKDCFTYASSRRYNNNPLGLIRNIISSFYPNFYDVKST